MTMKCGLFVACLAVFQLIGLALSMEPTRKYTPLEGDDLLVRCNATTSNDTLVYWSKNDTKSSTPFVQNGTDLVIYDIRREASGLYVCHLFNETTESNVTVNVIKVEVHYAAEIDEFSGGPDSLIENQTFLISCNMQGSPDPSWQIYNMDTGAISMKANAAASVTLGPIKARCESAGRWACTGRNQLNTHGNVTRQFHLTVYCSPRPKWGQMYSNRSHVGASASLVMNFAAYPRPQCIWSKADGNPPRASITTGDDYTSLDFQNVIVSDFGAYKLSMRNEYGYYTSQQFTLEAHGNPETPTDLQYGSVTEQTVWLYWRSGYGMGSPQRFTIYRVDWNSGLTYLASTDYDTTSKDHGVGKQWIYQLRYLATDTTYTIAIKADNTDGYSSETSETITFTTLPYDWPDYYHSDDNAGAIVGLVVGGIFGVLIIAAVLTYVFKWRKMNTSFVKQVQANERTTLR